MVSKWKGAIFTLKANDYSIIKAANRTLIYNTLLTKGPMSVMELLYETRLSRPTVENTLRDMSADGLIEKAGIARLSVGRSAQLYQIGTQALFAMGVDLEFPDIRLAVLNLQGERQYIDIWRCNSDMTAEHVISDLIDHMRKASAQVLGDEPDKRRLIGIGVGIGGLLDLSRGISLSHERINGWENIALPEILKNEFGVHVTMRNDVHMLAFIHRAARIKRGISNYCYISMRSGIGMVSYIKGDMYAGMMGNAGFFGHTTVDFNGPKCHCGSRGCLEGYLKDSYLTAQYALLTGEMISYEQLLSRCQKGEPQAEQIISSAYHLLGKAVSNVIKIMDIQNVVFNGLPQAAQEKMLVWVREGILECLDERIGSCLNISAESLTEEEKPMGAALLMLQRFIKTPKLNLTPSA